jgi:hypothetical protein
MTVERFVDDYVYRYHHKMFPVDGNGARLSCITTGDIRELPREQWPLHTVAEFARVCSGENAVDLNADAIATLARMQRTGNSRLMVTDEKDALRGVVTLKDLLGSLSLKLGLEREDGISEKTKQVGART